METGPFIIFSRIFSLASPLCCFKLCHLNDWSISEALDVLLWRCVTHLWTRFWAILISFTRRLFFSYPVNWSDIALGSHTVAQYSNVRLTEALFACSLTFVEFPFKFIFAKPGTPLAAAIISLVSLFPFHTLCDCKAKVFNRWRCFHGLCMWPICNLYRILFLKLMPAEIFHKEINVAIHFKVFPCIPIFFSFYNCPLWATLAKALE